MAFSVKSAFPQTTEAPEKGGFSVTSMPGAKTPGGFSVAETFPGGQPPAGQPGVNRPLTLDEYKKQRAREEERGILDKTIGAGVSFVTEGLPALGGYVKEFATGAVKEAPGLATEPWKITSTAAEAAARGTFDFLNIARMPIAYGRDQLIKKTTNLGPEGELLLDYNRYLENFQTMKTREQFERGGATMLGSIPQALGAQAGITIGEKKLPEWAAPKAATAELGSIVLDPSLLAGGFGKAAATAAKASSMAARTAARAPRLARGMEIARGFKGALGEDVGAGIAKVGRGLEAAGKTKPAQAIQKATPAVVGMSAVGAAMGAPMTIAAPMAALSAGIAFLKRGGQIVSGMGDAMSTWSRTAPGRASMNRLQQVALDEAAPEWLRRVARRGSKMGLGKGLEIARDIKQAAKAGTAIGAIPALTGTETAEEAGQMMGMGAGFGALGHVVMGPIMKAGTKKAMEDVDIASWHSNLDEGSKEIVSGMGRDEMLKAATMEAFVNSMRPTDEGAGVIVRYANDDTWGAMTGEEVGPAGAQMKMAVLGGERPYVVFNVDRMKGSTLGHEMFHALARDPRIVDQSQLNSMLFDTPDPANPDGPPLSTGLFDAPTLLALRNDYIGRFDPTSEAGRKMADEMTRRPERFDRRIKEEIAAELFGAMIDKAPGNFIKSLDSLVQRKIDAWLTTGQPLTMLQGLKKTIAQRLGLYKTLEGKIGSHIYPGLETNENITAALRNIMRARLDVFGDGPTGERGPRVRIGDEGKEIHAEFSAEEAAVDPRLVSIFRDADVWERNADGSPMLDAFNRPKIRRASEIRRIQAQRVQIMDDTLQKVALDEPGGMERVISADGTPRWHGNHFTEAQIAALDAALPPHLWPPGMTDKLRLINQSAQSGQPLMMNYNPALLRNKYSSRLGMTLRMGVPIAMDITKAGNFTVTTIDLVHLQDKLGRWWEYDQRQREAGKEPKYFETFESLADIDQAIKTYVTNHAEGRKGHEGLHEHLPTAMKRKHVMNDLFNVRTEDTDMLNPRRLSAKRGEKDTLIRSRRFDRINSIDPAEGDPMPLSYPLLKINYQPGADLTASAVKATPEPSTAPRSLSEDTGVSPKPPGEAPGIPKQEITSKATSLEQVPAKKYYDKTEFAEGTRNADIGAGKSELFTEYMGARGVENLRYDRFWQKPEEIEAFAKAVKNPTDSATVNNVLNVIAEPAPRDYVIRQAAAVIKPDGTAHFKIYEGDGSGKGKKTKAGYQNNRKAADYVKEIEQHFSEVTRKGDVLIARKPKAREIVGKDIMFQPGVKEKITHAALRVPVEDGHNIYTGPQHFVALAKAAKDLGLSSDYFTQNLGDIDGFMTDAGRFVSRAEAYRLHFGEEAAKVEAETRGEVMLDSADVPALKARFETETFRDVLAGDVPSAPHLKEPVTREQAARGDVPTKDGVRVFSDSVTYNGADTRYSPGSDVEVRKATEKFLAKSGLSEKEQARIRQIDKEQVETIALLGDPNYMDQKLMLIPQGESIIRPNAAPQYVLSFEPVTTCVRDLSLQAVSRSVTAQAPKLGIPTDGAILGSISVLRSRDVLAPCLECYKLNAQIQSTDTFSKAVNAWDKHKVGEGTPLEQELAAFRDAGFQRKWFDPLWKMTPVADRGIPQKFLDMKIPKAKGEGTWTLKTFMAGKLGSSARQAKGYAPYRGELLSDRGRVRINTFDGPKSISSGEFLTWVEDYGGFRFNSNSDFQPEHAIDYYQALGHLDARETTAHGYTNVPDPVEIFHKTGWKQNMSVYLDVVEGKVVGRKNQGMPLEKALELQRKSDNAGIVVIAHNEATLKWARDNPDVQYILPTHLGKRQKKTLEPLQWKDFGYGAEQFRGEFDKKKIPADLRRHVYMDDKGKPHVLIQMASYADLKKGDTLKNMWKKYKRICDRLGVSYRFENEPLIFGEVKGDPTKHTPPESYMKFIVDFARWDKPQKPIKSRLTDVKKMAEVVKRKIDEGHYTGHDGEKMIDAEDMMAVTQFLKDNKGKGLTGIVAAGEKLRMDAMKKDLR